ncbi:MAG TPA: hypothetical protein DFS52_06410 [Myxococcales bacterium]|jgi:hypothetical protein|nr:hypothetical protein [Myxococcales bacterium]
MAARCKWNSEEVIAKSAQQAKLFPDYGPQIEARTGPEVLNSVVTGSAKLRDTQLQNTDSRGDKCATTESQTNRLKATAAFLSTRRKAIAKRYPGDAAIKKAFGISDHLNNTSVASVTSAFKRFITAAEADPAQARAAMVTEEDVARMKQHLADINQNEGSQEGMKTTSKLSTAERNAIQCDLEEAMVKIVTAATLVFEDQPEVVALFKSTLPATKRSAKKPTPEGDAE